MVRRRRSSSLQSDILFAGEDEAYATASLLNCMIERLPILGHLLLAKASEHLPNLSGILECQRMRERSYQTFFKKGLLPPLSLKNYV